MIRSFTIASLLCLFFLGGECFAQGLLGKGHVSSQFLLFDTRPANGFRFDNYSKGWRAQVNAPVIWLENEEPFSGVAMDLFASLNGVNLASQNILGDTNQSNSVGGDVGVNLFFHATEKLRPFATAGMIWDTTTLKSATVLRPEMPPDPEIPATKTTTDLTKSKGFVGLGAEVDLMDWIAWRSSIVFIADSLDKPDAVNEIFLRPSESWFVRLSLVIDTSGNKIGGVGAGLTW